MIQRKQLRLSNADQIRCIINQFEANNKNDTEVIKKQDKITSVIGPSVKEIAKTFEVQNTELNDCNSEYDNRSKLSIVLHCLGVGFVSLFASVVPPVTLLNIGLLLISLSVFIIPKTLADLFVYPCCRLVFGTLYPAYASYKAVRTKNVKEYVKWMMYWIVFALFTSVETFTDIFLNWFPFYYEVKIVLVLWLLSPATKGSSILYRKFVHPALCSREQEIDEYIAKAKDQGYKTVLNLGTRSVNYGMNVIMQTALRGGGGLVQQLRKSYSLSDLSVSDDQMDSKHEMDEAGDIVNIRDPRLLRRSISARSRSPRASSVGSKVDMYFPEMDVDRNGRSVVGRDRVNLGHIRSSEDISSSYIPENNMQDSLSRTASNNGSRNKINKSSFTSIKRPAAAEESEFMIKELDEENMRRFLNEGDNSKQSTDPQELLIQQLAMLMMKELCTEDVNNDKQERFSKLMNVLGSRSQSTESLVEKVETSPQTSNVEEVDKKKLECTEDTSSMSSSINLNENNYSNASKSDDNEKKFEPILLSQSKNDNNELKILDKTVESEDSDDELSQVEFNTPRGSPLLQNKKRKNKKRQAPIPPSVLISASKEEINLGITNVTELPLSSEEEVSKIKRRDSKSPIRRLKNLSSKLTFWNKPTEHKKSIPNETNESPNNLTVEKQKDEEISLNDELNNKTNLIPKDNNDSEDEQFEDAVETDIENKNSNYLTNMIVDDNVTFIPLKIETLLVNTSSKSTDV